MTALTAPLAVAPRLRLTRRGRRVLAVAASLPILVALGSAVVFGGSALAAGETEGDGVRAAGAVMQVAFAELTVMPGESLWSIARDVAPAADPRDVIDAIVRVNALGDATVSAGQRLAIPTEYTAAR